jgi:hypothetical protein
VPDRCDEALADVSGEERSKLERDWDKSGNASTEDLRQALQRYRSFFLMAYSPFGLLLEDPGAAIFRPLPA